MSSRRPASPEKSRPSVFWLLGAIIVPLVGVLAKIEISGGEKLPRRGAYVLAPNHASEIDPLLVAVIVWRLGRAPRFLAKESLFRVPVLGWALRATGMIPVSRAASSAASREAIANAKALVEAGRGVIVYPEGSLTRDPDLWPMRGKTGAVRLALAGDIPLVPMAQWGAERIMPRYGRLSLWPLRKRIRVVIGDPVDLGEFATGAAQPAALARATDVVMGSISSLLSEIRGIPAPAERWNPSVHGQTETGRLDS